MQDKKLRKFAKITVLAEHKDYIVKEQINKIYQLKRKVPEWEIIKEMITVYKKHNGDLT